MQEPDLKASKQSFFEDIKDTMYSTLKNDRRAWVGGNDLELLVENICEQYNEVPNALDDLYELTPAEASAKLIEYYDEFWDEEKNSGELEL